MLHQSPTIIRVPKKNNIFACIGDLDSMGLASAETIVQVVQRTGNKNKYTHVHEWCCGHGAMGFEFMFQNLCEKLTLSDILWKAALSCNFVSAVNNFQDVCNVYVIEQLEDIPMPEEKWDLVISNPPYAPDDKWYASLGIELQEDSYDRNIDGDWRAHHNFFKNAVDYITPDCDIYLFGSVIWLDQQIEIAKSYQYQLIGVYDDLAHIATQVKLLHFRPPK
jgi:methylase of polypeptide subunit release factors